MGPQSSLLSKEGKRGGREEVRREGIRIVGLDVGVSVLSQPASSLPPIF